LQAFDADIFNNKGLKSPCRHAKQRA
jgi:hypothetical protein